MASIKRFIIALIALNSVLAESDLAPCDSNADCKDLKNATCSENFCKCGDSEDCNEAPIAIVTTIGHACTLTAACNIDGAICDETAKKCVCKAGMVAATSNRKCLNISEDIGGECIESVQCYQSIPFTGCQQNKCVCQQHTHEYNGSCYQDVALGQRCTIDANCSAVQFSKCAENRCCCNEGFVAVGKRCLSIAKSINDGCELDEQCQETLGGSARCEGGFCQCRELYQLKASSNKCVRDMLLNELCAKHSDCHGLMPGESRLECILGECKCRSFYREEAGYCISAGTRIQMIPVLLFLLFDVFLLQFC